jgi:2-phospho-L-lactate guanylyltransferase
MSGDLPALRSEDLEAAFAAGSGHARWFVADADGTGTTLLAASGGTLLFPAFGPGSRAAHTRSGAVDLMEPALLHLRRDVDTEEHLWEAMRLGVGRHTQAVLAELALVSSPRA